MTTQTMQYPGTLLLATVTGRPNLPPDYKTFTATVRLVLTVKGAGYRITQG